MATQLRKIRTDRGWSQSQLVRAIEIHARDHHVEIASTASLNVFISEWENERRSIGDKYAAILRAILGVTDAELRDTPTDSSGNAEGYDALLSRIDSAQSVGVTLVEAFYQQTELLRTFDRQRGARTIGDQMQAHLGALQDALMFAVLPGTRGPVATALAGAATLAAWQALDVGSVTRAWQHYETAKNAARDAGSTAYLAHAMAEQAYALLDAGRPLLALDLIREAQVLSASRVSTRLASWLWSAEAELCAHVGRPDECRRALDRAANLLPSDGETRDPEMLSIFLNSDHLARWRGNVLALLGDDDAVANLHTALESVDPTFVRAQAGLYADLAQAYIARGEAGEAQNYLRQARQLANRTGSARQLRRLERLLLP